MRSVHDTSTDLTASGYLRKWQQTLLQARRMMTQRQGLGLRMRARSECLRVPRRPIFVLGCPRSGTTFLGHLFEALPGVSYFFEPPAFKYYSRLVYERRVSLHQSRRFYKWGFRALMLVAPGQGPRIVEKNPTHTWIAADLLQIFPDASFIIICRDGRDVSVSLSEKPWHRIESAGSGLREPGGYPYGPYPRFYIEPDRVEEYSRVSDLRRCAWIWRRFAEETESLKTVLPRAQQYRLRYEDLITDPDRALSGLLEFIDENDPESRARMLTAAATGRSASIGRWKKDLSSSEVAEIELEAGDMLDRLGYARTN